MIKSTANEYVISDMNDVYWMIEILEKGKPNGKPLEGGVLIEGISEPDPVAVSEEAVAALHAGEDLGCGIIIKL